MKVLDPQSALLTTAEVCQFLKDNPSRKPDKKIGSYPPANLHNHQIVRSDLDNYATINLPHVATYPPVESFVMELITKLKPYHLTKTEVFTLINLGVGNFPVKTQTNGGTPREDNEAETVSESTESELSKSLFRLVVEESEQRFEGDAGEEKIDQILQILQECIPRDLDGSGNHINGYQHAEP